MNNDEGKEFIEGRIRRVLGFKALRQLRVLVDDIENKDARNKRFVKAIGLVILFIIVLTVLIYSLNYKDDVKEIIQPHSRTDEEIQSVFSKYAETLYKRYEDSLQNNPSLSGDIILRITVSSEGVVTDATVEKSTIDDSDLIYDISQIIKTIDLGKSIEPGNDITFLYPINFQAPGT